MPDFQRQCQTSISANKVVETLFALKTLSDVLWPSKRVNEAFPYLQPLCNVVLLFEPPVGDKTTPQL